MTPSCIAETSTGNGVALSVTAKRSARKLPARKRRKAFAERRRPNMFTPVPATLPDSTLAPAAILAKFSSQSLAGLGWGPSRWGMGDCPCENYDPNTGVCDDVTDNGCGGSNSGSLLPVYGTPTGSSNTGSLVPYTPVVSTTPGGTSVVASGSCDPGYYYVPAANGCLPTSGLTTTSGGSQVSGTAANASTATLLNALAQGSLTAAQIAAGVVPVTSVAPVTTTTISSSTLMLLALLGIGGVLLMSESRKGGR
jgi:hypothetical protein